MNDIDEIRIRVFNRITNYVSKLCVKFPLLRMSVFRDDDNWEFKIIITYKG